MDKAPLYSDVAEAPPGGTAYWLKARDNVRLRMAFWPKGTKGTVLMFPGRTEYIEKYGRLAGDLAAQDYATAIIDWRGQGLSDRLSQVPMLGHVGAFRDYQYDVEAMVRAGEVLRFPMPWFVLSHSMGGAIALRAVSNGLRVKAAVFSAPMWGIRLSPWLRPVAWTLGAVTRNSGLSRKFAPGTRPAAYTEVNPFKDNLLTRDKDSYDYMTRQTKTYPALSLGGPSIHWIYESLMETRRLRAQEQPEMPSLTWMGANERIIDVPSVQKVVSRWPGAKLEFAPDAEHELLMEVPATRKAFLKAATGFFAAHT